MTESVGTPAEQRAYAGEWTARWSTQGQRLQLAMRLLDEHDLAGARRVCQAAMALRPDHPASHFGLACVLAAAGTAADRQLALDELELAVQLGWQDRQGLRRDVRLDGLRDEPRFQALLRDRRDD